MPELPEVEYGRKLLEQTAVGRRITRVTCARDAIVYDGVTPARFRRALLGRTVVAARRRGKQLWLELDARPWPLIHFGMTGALRARGHAPAQLHSDADHVRTEWPPRFAKLRLEFDDGEELVFVNKRRLGRLRLRDDPEAEPPIANLGFDPLLDLPAPRAFAKLVTRRKRTLKGLLLDQSFAAGVGNWIADEVLYRARLDPRRRSDELGAAEVDRLRTALRDIIRRAVAVDADKERFPKTWLFHHRWGKQDDARTTRGERIEHLSVAGRTTAWVPSVQR